MRESELRLMLARNAKMEMLVLRQLEFMETRQRAIEQVLETISIWDRIMILMGRRSLKNLVDSAHLIFVKKNQEERKEVSRHLKEKNGAAHA